MSVVRKMVWSIEVWEVIITAWHIFVHVPVRCVKGIPPTTAPQSPSLPKSDNPVTFWQPQHWPMLWSQSQEQLESVVLTGVGVFYKAPEFSVQITHSNNKLHTLPFIWMVPLLLQKGEMWCIIKQLTFSSILNAYTHKAGRWSTGKEVDEDMLWTLLLRADYIFDDSLCIRGCPFSLIRPHPD